MVEFNVQPMPKRQHLGDETDEEDQFNECICVLCAGPYTKKNAVILLNLIRYPNSLQTLCNAGEKGRMM